MSVPPPSCTRISTSTGSSASSDRSTTLVSKTTSLTRNVGSPLRIPAITALWITDPAMLALWSTQMITSHGSRRVLRSKKRSSPRTSWWRVGS
jgi:hypothetical protein